MLYIKLTIHIFHTDSGLICQIMHECWNFKMFKYSHEHVGLHMKLGEKDLQNTCLQNVKKLHNYLTTTKSLYAVPLKKQVTIGMSQNLISKF